MCGSTERKYPNSVWCAPCVQLTLEEQTAEETKPVKKQVFQL
jgi:hypothetical protein